MAGLIQDLMGHAPRMRELIELSRSGRLPHALVFCGSEGIGKFRAALALAQGLVCEREVDAPCGTCGPCVRVAAKQSEALLVFDNSAGALKIEQAREILQFFSLRSASRARVVIVDEAQSMTPQAGNALLKALEEPAPNCYFILVTANPAMLLSTVRSRCQTVRLQNLTLAELRRLVPAPDWVLRASRGRVRVAQSLSLPELMELREKAFEPLRDLVEGRAARAMERFYELATEKEAALQLSRWWLEILRDALAADEDIVHMDQGQLLHTLRGLGAERLARLGGEWLTAERDLVANVDRHLIFDRLFLRMREQAS